MKLNEPVSISKDKDSSLGDAGNFHDHNTKLTWIGEGESHGTKCVLIRYESFFNTFTYKMGTIAVTGTSEYWCDIWLSKRTKRIENANLNESVTVLIGDAKVPFRSFRLLTFEAKRDKG